MCGRGRGEQGSKRWDAGGGSRARGRLLTAEGQGWHPGLCKRVGLKGHVSRPHLMRPSSASLLPFSKFSTASHPSAASRWRPRLARARDSPAHSPTLPFLCSWSSCKAGLAPNSITAIAKPGVHNVSSGFLPEPNTIVDPIFEQKSFFNRIEAKRTAASTKFQIASTM